MKRNEKYWQNRYKQLEKTQHNNSVKQFLDIQNRIDKSQSAITSKINAWYGRFASNNEISIEEARKLLTKQELKEFKWSVEEYIKYGRENAIDGRWMKELENASARFHISRLEALRVEAQNECEKLFGGLTDDIDRHIKEQYTDSYYHSAYEVMKGTGVGWEIGGINSDKLDMIVKKPWAVDGKNFVTRLGEDKATLINNIYNGLVQMCVNGENPDRVIAQLAKTMKNDKARASRIVMTESAYFSQEAQKQCFEDLDVEEFEIVATLDSDTDETCALRDGTHLPMREFQAGVTAPPFHPNCRCCTAPYFNDEWSNTGFRASRDEEGNTVYKVPVSMKYDEWVRNYVSDGMNYGELNYDKVTLSANKLNINENNININYHKIESAQGDFYLSDLTDIKPRKLHEIKKIVNSAYDVVGIDPADRPKVIIVSPDELSGAKGRYDAENHVLFVTKLEQKATQIHMTVHETLHLKDCLEYKNVFGAIASNDEVVEYNAHKAKLILDKKGVTIDNVGDISFYAKSAYLSDRYDEVYVELRTNELKKKVK